MPDYDFRTLSPVDFEHFARDILNADLGLQLQSYAAGRDQGIDLREVSADGMLIVGQCKHYLESSWSTFLGAVRKEAAKGLALHADRYLFVTCRPLTPGQQDKIVEALNGLQITHDDAWGKDALNAALVRHPEVERAHIKLWLSSAVMLDTLLNAGRWQRGDATLDEVRDHAKLWVHNPVYGQVQEVLEREGTCIVFGPPGVGKTFLAEMVLLSAIADGGWEAVHVSGDIEAAWTALRTDDTRQFFYFNDFLGETELYVASRNEPTNLARFIRRIRQLRATKRFLMTTREQIIGQAATSEYDPLRRVAADAEITGVRLASYSTRARAEILFNHIYFSPITEQDRARLAVDNRIVTIVDHPAYNPRLIQLGIEEARPQTAEEILDTIRRALDRPHEIWDTSFRRLRPTGQQILLSLATLPARPWPLDTIRLLAGSTGGALDWRPTLRVLEPTWLRITGKPAEKYAVLANPGCRDYLLGLLDDSVVAEEQVGRIRLLDQIVSLTRSAGLLPGTMATVHRPELAHALMRRHDQLTDQVRGFIDADRRQPQTQAKALNDAARLFGVFGSDSQTEWLLDSVTQLIETSAPSSGLCPADLFILAENLAVLSTGSQERRAVLVEQLVLTAIDTTDTTRDLDAYESLPEELRTPAVQEAARQAANNAIAAELDFLMRTVDEPETIRTAAEDLEHRARWYGLDVAVGDLLDRVDDLKAQSAVPEPVERPADPDEDSDDGLTISELFSRLTE
jgi:hypothetical protein